MGLETTASFSAIADLRTTWPLSSDGFSDVAAHVRYIKYVLTKTFPKFDAAVTTKPTDGVVIYTMAPGRALSTNAANFQNLADASQTYAATIGKLAREAVHRQYAHFDRYSGAYPALSSGQRSLDIFDSSPNPHWLCHHLITPSGSGGTATGSAWVRLKLGLSASFTLNTGVGYQMEIHNTLLTQCSLTAKSGVTVYSKVGSNIKLKPMGITKLFYLGSDKWIISGDIE